MLWAPKLDVKASFQSKLSVRNREKALKIYGYRSLNK